MNGSRGRIQIEAFQTGAGEPWTDLTAGAVKATATAGGHGACTGIPVCTGVGVWQTGAGSATTSRGASKATGAMPGLAGRGDPGSSVNKTAGNGGRADRGALGRTAAFGESVPAECGVGATRGGVLAGATTPVGASTAAVATPSETLPRGNVAATRRAAGLRAGAWEAAFRARGADGAVGDPIGAGVGFFDGALADGFPGLAGSAAAGTSAVRLGLGLVARTTAGPALIGVADGRVDLAALTWILATAGTEDAALGDGVASAGGGGTRAGADAGAGVAAGTT